MNLGKLCARNLLRQKARLVLTAAAVAVAVMSFITLRAALLSWDAAKDLARKDRLVTRHKVTFIMPLPARYVEDLRAARGEDGAPLVEVATFMSWFGGRVPGREREFFASMAIDARSYLDIYDEIELSPAERQTFFGDRSGAIVGEALAEQFGWHVGDRVTLESPIYPAPPGEPWTFTISGVYHARERSARRGFFFRHERFDDARPADRKGTVGMLASRAGPGKNTAEVGRAVDRLFEDRDVQTLSEDERAFNNGFMGMISAVLDVVRVLAGGILVIMALVLANAVGMSVRERTSEYATLGAVGFRPRHVVLLVVGESALVAALGGVIGIALAYVVVDRGLGRFFEENLAFIFPLFRVEASTLVLAFALAIALGMVAAAIPAIRASRLRVTEALRKVA